MFLPNSLANRSSMAAVLSHGFDIHSSETAVELRPIADNSTRHLPIYIYIDMFIDTKISIATRWGSAFPSPGVFGFRDPVWWYRSTSASHLFRLKSGLCGDNLQGRHSPLLCTRQRSGDTWRPNAGCPVRVNLCLPFAGFPSPSFLHHLLLHQRSFASCRFSRVKPFAPLQGLVAGAEPFLGLCFRGYLLCRLVIMSPGSPAGGGHLPSSLSSCPTVTCLAVHSRASGGLSSSAGVLPPPHPTDDSLAEPFRRRNNFVPAANTTRSSSHFLWHLRPLPLGGGLLRLRSLPARPGAAASWRQQSGLLLSAPTSFRVSVRYGRLTTGGFSRRGEGHLPRQFLPGPYLPPASSFEALSLQIRPPVPA